MNAGTKENGGRKLIDLEARNEINELRKLIYHIDVINAKLGVLETNLANLYEELRMQRAIQARKIGSSVTGVHNDRELACALQGLKRRASARVDFMEVLTAELLDIWAHNAEQSLPRHSAASNNPDISVRGNSQSWWRAHQSPSDFFPDGALD